MEDSTLKSIFEIFVALSIVISGSSGLIAAFGPTKDKNTEKPNKLGRILIWVICISLVIGVSSKILEFMIKEREDEKNRQKTEEQTKRADELVDKLNVLVDSVSESSNKLSDLNTKTDKSLSTLEKTSTELVDINSSTQIINSNLNKTYTKQNELLNEQEWVQYQLLRQNFSLEPLKIHYFVIYKMNLVVLKEYTERLLDNIWEYEFSKVGFKYWMKPSIDSIRNVDFDYPLDSLKWLPQDSYEESGAKELLLSDDYVFYINQKNRTRMIFRGLPEYTNNVLLNYNSKSKVFIWVNFYRKLFIKYVICDNPIRSGDDNLSFSAIDLIGSVLGWEYPSTLGSGTFDKIGFEFPFDGHYESFNRFIDIPRNTNAVIITASNVGLDRVLSSISSIKTK